MYFFFQVGRIFRLELMRPPFRSARSTGVGRFDPISKYTWAPAARPGRNPRLVSTGRFPEAADKRRQLNQRSRFHQTSILNRLNRLGRLHRLNRLRQLSRLYRLNRFGPPLPIISTNQTRPTAVPVKSGKSTTSA